VFTFVVRLGADSQYLSPAMVGFAEEKLGSRCVNNFFFERFPSKLSLGGALR